MGGRRLAARAVVVLAIGACAALAGASCVASYSRCDYTIRRCRTVCDYVCDFFGCHPVCADQCWYECWYVPPPSGPTQLPPSPPPPPPTASPSTGSRAGDAGGGGALCSPCASNDDCRARALCVQPGGEAGPDDAFCSAPCAADEDCPAGFSCEPIGEGKQCLPDSHACP